MPDISLLPQTLVVAGMLLIMLVLLTVVMLPDAVEDTWFTRLYQGLMFRRTRLAGIMAQRGVNVSAYLNGRSAPEIRNLRLSCAQCSCSYYCDKQRRQEHFRYADLIFCPNRSSLTFILD